MAYVQPQLPPPLHTLDRVAFAGPMCSGKTTLATVLADDYDYTKVGFATLLKDIATELYGVVEKNNEGRKLLQEFADDLKKWDANLFTTHLLMEVEGYMYDDLPHTGRRFVLDDLRFQHEFDALKRNGFTIIGVACEEEVRQARIRKLYPDTDPARFNHVSEQEWQNMNFDYWIDNTTEQGITTLVRMFENVPQPV